MPDPVGDGNRPATPDAAGDQSPAGHKPSLRVRAPKQEGTLRAPPPAAVTRDAGRYFVTPDGAREDLAIGAPERSVEKR
jgi:hypothetical protein